MGFYGDLYFYGGFYQQWNSPDVHQVGMDEHGGLLLSYETKHISRIPQTQADLRCFALNESQRLIQKVTEYTTDIYLAFSNGQTQWQFPGVAYGRSLAMGPGWR